MSVRLERTTPFASKKQTILFLRWVVILATAYVVVFSDGTPQESPWVPLFVVAFLATNLAALPIPARRFEHVGVQATFLVVDTIFISLAMLLSGTLNADLFLLYFSVLFLAAIGENLAMIAGGCVLIAFLYLAFMFQTHPVEEVLRPSVLLRIPFLFGIGTFYGYLVIIAKAERQRAEQALASERFRTDFLATLTHDLQSPLSAIAGFSDLLLETQNVSKDQQRIADAIKRASNECGELVTNFLAMVRGEARPERIRRQMVDLNTVAEEVLQLYEPSFREKDIEVEANLTYCLPPVSGDRTQLRRALSNLLANAVKYTPQGSRIEVRSGTDGPSALTLSVIDSGPGVPDELQRQIFDRYTHDPGETGGTGLGLFVVRLVAEAHGGSVSLHSRYGDGARFTLRLPLPADVPVPSESLEAPAEVSLAPAETEVLTEKSKVLHFPSRRTKEA